MIGDSYEPAEVEFSLSYDAEETKWSRLKLREAFAATQSDDRVANRLLCAAKLFRSVENESYPPNTIGWHSRMDKLAHIGEDIADFVDIISARYALGGETQHPRLQTIMDVVNADPDRAPSAIARRLKEVYPVPQLANDQVIPSPRLIL